MMQPTEGRPLEEQIDMARNSTTSLRTLFAELDDQIGHDRASQLWWAAFGAEDAAET